jgi:hypothetical protein
MTAPFSSDGAGGVHEARPISHSVRPEAQSRIHPVKTVLDSTEFCADMALRGNDFRVFIEGSRQVGLRLCVPEAVLDEVINKRDEELRGCLAELRKTCDKWRRITGSELPALVSHAELTRERATYETFLRNTLDSLGAVILPYPGIQHRELVLRALHRRKPFDQLGATGYRDALIWETVRLLVKESSAEVLFVTRNKRDFFVDGPNLHPDLVGDLEAMQVPPARLRVFDSLKSLNEKIILPTLKQNQELMTILNREKAVDGFSLEEWVRNYLPNALSEGEYAPTFLRIDPTHASVSIDAVRSIEDLQVKDVRVLPTQGSTVIIGYTRVLLSAVVVATWQQYSLFPDVRSLFPGLATGFDSISSWHIVRAEVNFIIIMESSTGSLSAEVDEAHGTEVLGVTSLKFGPA